MNNRGGVALQQPGNESDRTLEADLGLAEQQAWGVARDLIAALARPSSSLQEKHETVQRMREAIGRLHEAVTALLITSH